MQRYALETAWHENTHLIFCPLEAGENTFVWNADVNARATPGAYEYTSARTAAPTRCRLWWRGSGGGTLGGRFRLRNGMESFVITPKTPDERASLTHFLASTHLRAKILTDDEKEDLGMLLLMSEVDISDTVPEEEIRKILSAA